MNRLRIITASVILVFSVSMFSGCQLAKEAYSTVESADRLCGVLVTIGTECSTITTDSVNHLTVKGNGVPALSKDIFAIENDNKIDGKVYDDGTAEFDGMEGYYMGLFQEFNDKGEITMQGMNSCPELVDPKLSVNITDTSEEHVCEANLYLNYGFHDILHLNPVYRRSDGTYYVINSIGRSMGMMIDGYENQSGAKNLSNSYTDTIGGKSHTVKDSFSVNFSIKKTAGKILIKEMNQKDELLKTTEFHRTDSGSFHVESNTAYVIVEELGKNKFGDAIVNRTIYTMDPEKLKANEVKHTYYIEEKNGVLKAQQIEFQYQ